MFYNYYEDLLNPLCSKAMLVFYLTQALYVYTSISMGATL
jgi:hypothetical protein